MKLLLYITAFPPNSRSGGQSFSLNALKDLSKKFIVDLIYFSYPGHECEAGEYVRHIKVFNASLTNCFSHPLVYPLYTKRFNKSILEYINSVARNYDVIYFDYTQTAFYALYVKHQNIIVRCHDIMAQKFSRQHPLLLPWIKRTERKIFKSVDRVFVPSEKDAEIVMKTYKVKTVFTHEYLHDFVFPKSLMGSRSFLFFGLWSRKENLQGLIWFVKKVLPLIKSENKPAFYVMGGGLSSDNKAKYLDPNQITYLGFVKDSYGTIVQNSAVIVPLFAGAGVKVKVLDAFATGTPVIGTTIALEGIPFVSGLTIKVSSPESFAEKINNFHSLSLEEKMELQKQFLRQYNNHHLTDYL